MITKWGFLAVHFVVDCYITICQTIAFKKPPITHTHTRARLVYRDENKDSETLRRPSPAAERVDVCTVCVRLRVPVLFRGKINWRWCGRLSEAALRFLTSLLRRSVVSALPPQQMQQVGGVGGHASGEKPTRCRINWSDLWYNEHPSHFQQVPFTHSFIALLTETTSAAHYFQLGNVQIETIASKIQIL